MEDRQQRILSEVKTLMTSIRRQLEQLDAKMAQLQQSVEPQVFDLEPIDISIDDFTEVYQEPEPVPPLEPVAESHPDAESVSEPVAVSGSESGTPVIDLMTAKQAWRTDMPGAPVKDIRSAISLNDRVLFINRLFGEDPLVFQETLNRLNRVGTLDEAVGYLAGEYPDWDFDSETVYRFMMALRRKVN